MSDFTLKPVVKAMLRNPPGPEAWLNLFQYKIAPRSKVVRHTPVSLVIYVSKRCNFKCSFCFTYGDLNKATWKQDELSPDQFKSMLQSHFGRRSLRVGFLGGEPFLNEHLFTFLRMAHAEGKVTTVVTNASLVKEKEKKALLVDHPTMLGISMYENNLPEVADLSKWLAENEIPFWVQTVITADEIPRMEEKLSFAKSHKIKNLIMSNYQPSYSGESHKVIYQDNGLFQLEILKIQRLAKKMSISLTLPEPIRRDLVVRACRMPFSYVHVDARGNLGPCCFRAPQEEYGNLFHEESWNNEKHQNLRESFLNNSVDPWKECRTCENFSRDLYGV